jgi:hypothetical protein
MLPHSFRVHTNLVRLHEYARQKRQQEAKIQEQDASVIPPEQADSLSSDDGIFTVDSDLSSLFYSRTSNETNINPEPSESLRKDSASPDLEMNNFQDPQVRPCSKLDFG